jgi:uncharacterized protein (DUF2252 family)
VPRSDHAKFDRPKDRPDPVAKLVESDRPRDPRLLPIRYGRMARSPFDFLRGSTTLMARDLAGTPTTGLRVQLCGDAHLNNFGIVATPERNEVFDVDDFDETLPGPWEWDLKRLAVSLVIAGRQKSFARSATRRAVRRTIRTYRESMLRYASMRFLDTWYDHLDRRRVEKHVSRLAGHEVATDARRARRRTVLEAFPRLARAVGRGYRIRDDPPLIDHYSESEGRAKMLRIYPRYLASLPDERRALLERYTLVDVAQKVVGVGSVGTRCSVLLLLGDPDVDDPVLLQSKQALPSVFEPYVGASAYSNHAERVVVGQRLIQEASDVFLGWSRVRDEDFYVRQLRDMRFSPDVADATPRSLVGKGELCGATLARAHARTGDAAAISGYLGEKDVFDEAIVRFAEVYAEQVEEDYRLLLAAVRSGRLPSGAR